MTVKPAPGLARRRARWSKQWRAQRERLVLRGHAGAGEAAGFSPDGARIVSGSDDNTVRVWDAASGDELLVLRGHEGTVMPRGFRRMARASSAGPSVTRDGAGVGRRERGRSCWSCAAMRGRSGQRGFPPDGARIVSGSDDKTVRVWDAASGAELLVLRGHEGPVYGRRVFAGWRAHRERVR